MSKGPHWASALASGSVEPRPTSSTAVRAGRSRSESHSASANSGSKASAPPAAPPFEIVYEDPDLLIVVEGVGYAGHLRGVGCRTEVADRLTVLAVPPRSRVRIFSRTMNQVLSGSLV